MEYSCKWQRTLLVATSIVFAALALVFYNSRAPVNFPQQDEASHSANQSVPEPTRNVTIGKKSASPVASRLPRCARVHVFTVLAGIIQELQLKKTTCAEYECHADGEDAEDEQEHSRGLFIVYIAVTLLLVSLIAELVEVYRARKNPARARSKPELSRRCSLADLTVLRHNRRESMMRRDSVMHMSLDGPNHRVPLKILAAQQSGDRRSSLPLVSARASKWRRSLSADKEVEPAPETHHRIHMIRHH